MQDADYTAGQHQDSPPLLRRSERLRRLIAEYGLETTIYVAALVIVIFEIGKPS